MKIKYFELLLLLMIIPQVVLSQITTNELPPTLRGQTLNIASNKISSDIFTVPAPDMNRIRLEDAQNDTIPGIFRRTSISIPVNFNSDKYGKWQNYTNDTLCWSITLRIEDAQSLDLVFDKFWLPEGGKLFVYNKQTSQAIGAVTNQYLQGSKENPSDFSTGIIIGDELTIEYYQPAAIKERPIISISRVYYGYRDIPFTLSKTRSFGGAGSCQVNVNCIEGQSWQEDKRAVARIYIKTPTMAAWCSGALVNNTSKNLSPLFLTANHCLGGAFDAITDPNLSQWIFYWQYEFPGCNNESTEPTIHSTTGATLKANNDNSDFALLQLTQDPRNLTGFTPYYLGWDNSGNAGTGGVGIHHPRGDVKKIATYNITPSNSNCFYNNGISFWKINWMKTSNGFSVTEGGSSGSPLLNNNHKVIGQLYGAGSCPNPNCSNPSQDIANYGKFSVSWTGNGATDNRRRLKDWLDPLNKNPQTLDGIGAYNLSIFGPSYNICDEPITYTIKNLPAGIPFAWSVSPDIQIISEQGNSITVKRDPNLLFMNSTAYIIADIGEPVNKIIENNEIIVWKGGINETTDLINIYSSSDEYGNLRRHTAQLKGDLLYRLSREPQWAVSDGLKLTFNDGTMIQFEGELSQGKYIAVELINPCGEKTYIVHRFNDNRSGYSSFIRSPNPQPFN